MLPVTFLMRKGQATEFSLEQERPVWLNLELGVTIYSNNFIFKIFYVKYF